MGIFKCLLGVVVVVLLKDGGSLLDGVFLRMGLICIMINQIFIVGVLY